MAKKLKIPWGDSFVRREHEWAEVDGRLRALILLLLGPFIIFMLIFSYFGMDQSKQAENALIAGGITTALIFIFYNIFSKSINFSLWIYLN